MISYDVLSDAHNVKLKLKRNQNFYAVSYWAGVGTVGTAKSYHFKKTHRSFGFVLHVDTFLHGSST